MSINTSEPQQSNAPCPPIVVTDSGSGMDVSLLEQDLNASYPNVAMLEEGRMLMLVRFICRFQLIKITIIIPSSLQLGGGC